jgi:hypothetical protein
MRALSLVLTLLLAAGCGSTPPASSPPAAGPSAVPRVWPLPADPAAAAAKAGLPMLNREMLEVHYHAHLDVLVRGVAITVPAGIGIDPAEQAITPLHTHDTTGIVHIESAENIPFTLGQLFTEWGQPLSATQVGPVTVAGGEQVRLYRNGKQVPGNPAAYRFAAHDELVVWLGPADQQPQVPSSYQFPEGL